MLARFTNNYSGLLVLLNSSAKLGAYRLILFHFLIKFVCVF